MLYSGEKVQRTNLVFLQHLFLLQRLHRIDPARIRLLHDANLTERALPNDLHGPEVGQPHLRPLQPQEGSLLLPQRNQLPLFPLVRRHRISRELSLDLHTPANTHRSTSVTHVTNKTRETKRKQGGEEGSPPPDHTTPRTSDSSRWQLRPQPCNNAPT